MSVPAEQMTEQPQVPETPETPVLETPEQDVRADSPDPEIDWAAVFGGQEPEPEQPAQPETPQPQQAAPEPQAETPPVQPQAAPQQPEPAPVEVPAQPAVQQPQSTPEVAPQAQQPTWEQIREQAMPQLEQRFALTEDQRAEFDQDPAAAIPKIMSRVMLDTYQAIFSGLTQGVIQQIVAEQLNTSTSEQRFMDKFYQRWEKLKPYDQTVRQVIQANYQMNPKMSQDDLIKQAGLQAMIMHRIPIEGLPTKQPQPQQPFQPAQPAAASQTPADPTAGNPWAEMTQEALSDQYD